MRSTDAMKGAEARGRGGEAEKGGGVMLYTDRSLLASHMITHTHGCTHTHR